MRIIGLDIHRAFAEAVAWKDGKLSRLGRVIMRREALKEFAKQLSNSDIVVIEATGNAASVAAVIGPHVSRVVIANPKQVRLIAHAKIKTDKIDAGVLAQLYASGFLPEVWIADEATQALRRQVTIAILPAPAHRRGRPPPMVATPAAPISPPPRPAALPTSPSTRSAASPLPRWSRALGSTVVCGIFAPASRRRSPASSARTVPPVAPGADWTTSRPTSGPPWWRTIWCCSPGSNRLSRARLQADENKADQVALNCSFADSRPGCRYQRAKCAHRPSRSCRSAPATPLRKHAFMDAH